MNTPDIKSSGEIWNRVTLRYHARFMETPDTTMSTVQVQIGSDASGRSTRCARDISDISESLPAQLLCSGKWGGSGDTAIPGDSARDTRIQSWVITSVRFDRGIASEGTESEGTTTRTAWDHQSSVTVDEEGLQGLNQRPFPVGNKKQATIKQDTPVTLRTRRRLQQAAAKWNDNSKRNSGQATERYKDKELIRQLTAQIEEQRNIIDKMSSALTKFLKSSTNNPQKKYKGTLKTLSVQLPWRNSKSKFLTVTREWKWSNPLHRIQIIPWSHNSESSCYKMNFLDLLPYDVMLIIIMIIILWLFQQLVEMKIYCHLYQLT